MSGSAQQQITFITGYYQIERRGSYAAVNYMAHFKTLVETGAPLVFFHDPGTLEEELKPLREFPNLKIVEAARDTFRVWQAAAEESGEMEIPAGGHPDKDTADYLRVQNMKTELVVRGLEHCSTPFVAWIDAGICKVVGDQELFVRQLKRMQNCSLPADKITLPGCWPCGEYGRDNVSWRFCGGFFICPRDLTTEFNEQSLNVLLGVKKLTWEVNVWAEVEQGGARFFNWYSGDHNNKMFDVPLGVGGQQKRIILTTMVKNESRIIERLIRSVLGTCDAICVCDTGSTDDTRDIVRRLARALSVPVIVYEDAWQNFGHNRSISFTRTQEFCTELGWPVANTYGLLLDGDMLLRTEPAFKKDELTDSGYMIKQKSGALDYYNMRLVRLDTPWKCRGVTHEYWDGPGRAELPDTKIWISDIGDGGCKADKFIRDIALLTKGLEEEPDNGRYYFYLAQSYKDIGQRQNAIETYKKRLEKSGWDEEMWYSKYMIAKCYLEEGDVGQAEVWAQKALDERRHRAEPAAMMIRHFREKGQQWKAMHYFNQVQSVSYPSADKLFVEKQIYGHFLPYEYTILAYYTNSNKIEGTKKCTEYLNKYREHWDNVFTNLQFYMPRLAEIGRAHSLNVSCPDSDFRPSSVSLLVRPGKPLLANVRFVNYKILPNGSYEMMENGVYSPGHHVRTKNGWTYLDDSLQPADGVVMMNESGLLGLQKTDWTNIRGLEDVRLFMRGSGKIGYTATTREWSYNGRNRIVMGDYCVGENTFRGSVCMKPPSDTECEKNWIALGQGQKDRIIYKWSPFEIGEVGADGQLEIVERHTVPAIFFERMRGSTSLVEYEGDYWCVVHTVVYETPRRYYHNLVVLDKTTLRPKKMSIPFCFTAATIEYCLGFVVMGSDMVFAYSVQDSNPQICRVAASWFKDRTMIEL
jgi:tetratricopeptide (TPR) repeat protein